MEEKVKVEVKINFKTEEIELKIYGSEEFLEELKREIEAAHERGEILVSKMELTN